jgi:integral membrane protein
VTLTWFRWIGRAEALSLILLMGVAMPLKYALGRPEAVQWVGWVHGILFLVYVIALGSVARVEGWSWPRIALGVLASMVPFGPLAFERSPVPVPLPVPVPDEPR